MPTYPIYSSLFSTIYDEQRPVGHLGRGTHYSILRCVEWLDVIRAPLTQGQIHDFAVVWDEDHDDRVIAAIEKLYINGLLSPVQFLGERKGVLTLIVAAKFYFYDSEAVLDKYKQEVKTISSNLGFDVWTTEIGSFDRSPGSPHQCFSQGLIAADEHRILTYLRNIDSLWNLGTKNYDGSKFDI